MKDNKSLDVKKIAKALGAEYRGKVTARGGHFGAMQLVAEIQARFRIPATLALRLREPREPGARS